MNSRTLAWLALGLLPLFAHAEEPPSPCRRDVEQLCPAALSDRKAGVACLIEHQKDISDACYDDLKKRLSKPPADGGRGEPGERKPPGEGGQKGLQACRKDVDTLCPGIQPGGGRLVSCLVEHQKEISDACYDEVARHMKQRR